MTLKLSLCRFALWVLFAACLELSRCESSLHAAEPIVVVAPEGPLPCVLSAEGTVHRSAADDLCDYLSRVTGRTIVPGGAPANGAVIIHVGPDSFALSHAPEMKELFADGYVLKSVPIDNRQHLILAGLRGNASRWAVEAFLKRFCGVRWLFPNDEKYGEIVPSRPTVSVDAEFAEKHEPSFLGRANCQMYFFDKSRTYLRLGPSDADFGSHAFQHAFDRADFQAHPDWFALFSAPDSDLIRFHPELVGTKNRKRRWHWDYGNGWQISTSHPETVQHAVEYARAWFEKNPESVVVAMGHNDGEGWCECERCQAFIKSANPPYTQSEQYWNWVNQVTRELAKTHPDKLVATIAYGTPASPPRFELEKNIAVTLTFSLESQLELARTWKEKCRSVNLYSYPYGSNVFAGFRHYPHAMRDFLKWGHNELGAISHVAEVYGDWSFDGPKYHYMQALQWDVNVDPEALMDEYCRDRFGAASQPMHEFWNRLEQVYERSSKTRRLIFYDWVGWSDNHDEFDHYTLADVDALDRAITSAEQKADTEADQFRVARVADAWQYFRSLLTAKLQFCDRRDEVLAKAKTSPARGLTLARSLAALQFQRTTSMRRLRSYQHMNPQLTTDYYWSGLSKVDLFSRMRTLQDELCDLATHQMMSSGGRESTIQFWKTVEADDVICDSARTQLSLLAKDDRPNLFANGDFESGATTGWNVTGDVRVVTDSPRNGHLCAESTGQGTVTISQSVHVRPLERCRLSAWLRSAGPSGSNVNGSMTVDFQSAGRPVYPEPTYLKLPKTFSNAEWSRNQVTFTVPPGADAAIVSLRFAGVPLRLDDLSLERIQDGPNLAPGLLVDDFSHESHTNEQWAEAFAGGSGELPAIADGRLVFQSRPMATLVSLNSFDNVLDGTDDQRCRLRVHVARGANPQEAGSFDCGIGSGHVPITTRNSGFYFTHTFAPAGQKKEPLRSYWNQDSKSVASGSFELPDEISNASDVWYTFYFDPKEMTVFAGSKGYDERPEASLGKFAHQMTRIASQGPVFLKICGGNVALDEISLMRPSP